MQKSILRLAFCQQCPKIELHAHLHGCVRKSTLKEFLTERNIPFDDDVFKTKDMRGSFRIFDYIHKSITSLDQVRRMFNEMIEDFEAQNVLYLELRTTPKDFPGSNCEDYVRTLLVELEKRGKAGESQIIVKLLLSMSRSESLEKARETLEIAKKYKDTGYIIGLDYSGSPFQKSFRDFIEIYQEGRDYGLKIAVHTAELPDEKTKQETDEILTFKPDRIGHFNYFNEEQLNKLIELKIPVETCPTSNKFTMELNEYKEHHFKIFMEREVPFCVCTDDTVVFDTDISQELYRICSAFDLSEDQAKETINRSIDCIFEESLKKSFKEKIRNFSFPNF